MSTGLVALAEIGDKTQLLSLLLAARYRRPVPIILGILVATAVNHALAGALGAWITGMMSEHAMRWLLGGSFIAMAAWMLIPDRIDVRSADVRFGVLGTTIVAFFLAEMGDKTQIATIALAAKYGAYVAVVVGTTLGMMIANVPRCSSATGWRGGSRCDWFMRLPLSYSSPSGSSFLRDRNRALTPISAPGTLEVVVLLHE